MNYDTKRLLSRIGAIGMACLIAGGVVWGAVSAMLESSEPPSATYPPLFVYEGEYYALTGREIMDLPDDLTQVYAKVIGDQEEFPYEDNTCNFGSGLMDFRVGDGEAYIEDGDGDWLICQKVDWGE